MELNRRQFLKNTTFSLAGLFTMATGLSSYSLWVEPSWLEITHTTIELERLPTPFHGLKLVQFSDVHLGDHYQPDDLAQLVMKIQEIKPDLICFTGDLVDYEVTHLEKCFPLLQQLKAPLGKYAVLGNHDCYGREKKVTQALKNGGFRVLTNGHHILNKGEAQLVIAGVDDQYVGSPNIQLALRQVPDDSCTILLSHCPDYADIAKEHAIDLQLSGHSHGGQIRLPGIGHIMTPDFAKKYVQGLHFIENSKLQVYTNRGIGTTILPIRLFCRPELGVIELVGKSS